MTRIYCFGVTQERAPFVQEWSKKIMLKLL